MKDLVSRVVSTATVEAGAPLFACGVTLPALKFAFFDTAERKVVAPHHSLMREKA